MEAFERRAAKLLEEMQACRVTFRASRGIGKDEFGQRLAAKLWLPSNHREPDRKFQSPQRPSEDDVRIKPQTGPQEMLLSCEADVVVMGGAAGGGKSYGLLLDCLRYVDNQHFTATILRRTFAQITKPGALWDQAAKLYPKFGAVPRRSSMSWEFPSGARVMFGHLQHEDTVLNFQGSELALIGIDEGTQISEYQFWYLMSRNRTTCGMKPCVRVTCNPDADSWLASFIEWWISPESGYPINERAGVIRWFVRINEKIEWADSWQALHEANPTLVAPNGIEPDGIVEKRMKPKTATFIPAKLTDNAALMTADPGYMANLQSLPLVERERLLGGNWKIRPEAGKVFNRHWFELISALPAGKGEEVRFWDFAATERKVAGDDPDYTCGLRMRAVNGVYYITDCILERKNPAEIVKLVLNVSAQDKAAAEAQGVRYRVAWEEEPGAAAKYNTRTLARDLAGFECKAVKPNSDKLQRAYPLSSQAEHGNVKIVPSMFHDKERVEQLLQQLHNMPDFAHDDACDGCSGAFGILATVRRANVW